MAWPTEHALDGLVLPFYGVDGNLFKLGTTVFEAIEDEGDGYRSMLGDVVIVEDVTGLVFSNEPFATVTVTWIEDGGRDSSSEGYEGYKLEDANGHVWLYVGTDDLHDYYPMFYFHYEPSGEMVSPMPEYKPKPFLPKPKLVPLGKPKPAFEPPKIVINMPEYFEVTGRKFKDKL